MINRPLRFTNKSRSRSTRSPKLFGGTWFSGAVTSVNCRGGDQLITEPVQLRSARSGVQPRASSATDGSGVGLHGRLPGWSRYGWPDRRGLAGPVPAGGRVCHRRAHDRATAPCGARRLGGRDLLPATLWAQTALGFVSPTTTSPPTTAAPLVIVTPTTSTTTTTTTTTPVVVVPATPTTSAEVTAPPVIAAPTTTTVPQPDVTIGGIHPDGFDLKVFPDGFRPRRPGSPATCSSRWTRAVPRSASGPASRTRQASAPYSSSRRRCRQRSCSSSTPTPTATAPSTTPNAVERRPCHGVPPGAPPPHPRHPLRRLRQRHRRALRHRPMPTGSSPPSQRAV